MDLASLPQSPKSQKQRNGIIKVIPLESKTTFGQVDRHPTKGDCRSNAVTPVTPLHAFHRLALPFDRHAIPGALLRAKKKMHDVEFIEHEGRRFVLIPERTWKDIKGGIQRLLAETGNDSGMASSFAPPLLVQAAIAAGSSELRAWRRFRGLPSAQLAKRVGVTRAYISMIETGRRRPAAHLLQRLAHELDIPVCALATSHGDR
ncbi:helix-turn-helix domain-containing protein [Cupriavidus alkaliphilus]|uniref:helix-turn-helix domain-containing protein n=1 Tax=Cupriavidus alkaliphilus TaxID=942866 RepID=UPI000DD99756|nr:helix-turn-helix transcriptional regulator [Cupriavidus alkaliphilus]